MSPPRSREVHRRHRPCRASLGGDAIDGEVVDIYDLTLLGANFGLSVPPAAGDADITSDGVVSIFDIVLVGINYGLIGPTPWLRP